MKPSTENEIAGKVHEVKGAIKEATGKAVGNKKREEKGRIEKTSGAVQRGYGNTKEEIKKSI